MWGELLGRCQGTRTARGHRRASALGRRCGWVVIATTAACFHPSYDRPRCGPDGACPAGLACSAAQVCERTTDDAGPQVGETCWVLQRPTFEQLSLCARDVTPTLTIAASVELDTDSGTSQPAGVTCRPVSVGSSEVCAVIADTIAIAPGATLAAHGSRALAVLAKVVDVGGAIDVASHNAAAGGRIAAGATQSGCNAAAQAIDNGGGAGGRFSGLAGNGGDGGSKVGTGGRAAASISSSVLHGGCAGARPGDGSGLGGHGGGSLWLSAESLQLRATAVINASGASGASGATGNQGGFGGGSGGMILVQAPTIALDPAAQVFANGGHGGCGALGNVPGAATTDPTGPSSGGGVGPGGPFGGRGGAGFPETAGLDGGRGERGGGGGGGGGGPGEIRVLSGSTFTGPNISPAAVPL